MVWLIPSYHGDIKLEKEGPNKTLLRAYELTASEQIAMEKLRDKATSKRLVGKPWAKASAFLPLTNAAYRTTDGVTIHLDAKIEDVQRIIVKAMKPERKLLMAVRFTDGKVEELHSVKNEGSVEILIPEKEKVAPVVATTVARPVNGCPMPAFPEADIRASRVLESFLTEDQIHDYRSTGSFVTVGADTERRYIIGNRERPQFLQKYLGGRQLWDMENKRAICVHDWSVPPPEEMLAIHLCLSLLGHETELLNLPEVDAEVAMRGVNIVN
jgi:hypothetical protein